MSRLGELAERILPKGQFARNVGKIAGGTALGQGIVLLAMPLLTRIYTPSHFGLLSVYGSILSMVLVVSALRFEVAIPIPQDEADAAHVLAVALLSVGVIFVSVTFGCFLGNAWLLDHLRVPGLKPYLSWVLPIGVIGGGAYQVMSNWTLRRRDYSCLAKTRLYQGIAQVLTQTGLGLLLTGPLGLLIGADVGRLSGTGTLARAAWREGRASISQLSWKRLWVVAHRYRRFPLISAGSALLNAAGLYLPAVIVTTAYSTEVGGQFSLSQRIIAVPMALVGQAIGQVYMAEGAALLRERPEGLHSLVNRTIRRLLLLGVGPMAILALMGPWGFQLVFGSNWAQAGLFIRILSPMYLLQFITLPLSSTLLLLEKQGLQLLWDVGRMVTVLGTLFVPVSMGWGPAWAVGLFGLSMGILYLFLILLIRKATRQLSEEPHVA